MYFVNNVVDINNLMSLKSHFPICAFNVDHVHPPVEFTLGSKKDHYKAIGRGLLHTENLPVFSDKKGNFSSPTSDSERVKITEKITSLSMNMASFSGKDNLEETLEELEDQLKAFAGAKETERNII